MSKFRGIIVYILICCMALVGCSNSEKKIDVEKIIESSEQQDEDKNLAFEDFSLTVWSSSFDEEFIQKKFHEIYPKAKINVVKYDGNDTEKMMEAIQEGNGTDVIIYHSSKIGKFNSTDAFEELSQKDYYADELTALINENELSQCMSFDGKKLIGLPFMANTMVTYYREDILMQHGITTDPEQLVKLMETPEGWLSIAKELKKDNISIVQWRDEFVKMVLDEYGIYDKDLNLNTENEKLKDAVGLIKEIYNHQLAGEQNIWVDNGKKEIKEGKIAMTYMNRWGEENIKEFAPETAGKWKATKLPLGLNSHTGSDIISISSTSQYKRQAWNLVKKLIEGDRNYYSSITNDESEFLGGQKSKQLYDELTKMLPKRYPTMLDEEAYSLFIDNVNKYGNTSNNADELINSIKTKIENTNKDEKAILTEYLKEN